MTTISTPAASALLISTEDADELENRLYEIEALSLAMDCVLKNPDLAIDYALRAVTALRKEIHIVFGECTSILDQAGILKSARMLTPAPR